MPKAKKPLTDRRIAALRAHAGKRMLEYDAVVPGLAVSVTENGSKTFVLYTRYPGQTHPARRALGVVGRLTLARAREKATNWLQLIDAGKDPSEEEERRTKAAQRARKNTFAAVAEDYIRECVSTHRRAERTEREIRRELISRWGDRPIASITIDDVADMCADYKRRGLVRTGHNVFGHARTLFKWAVGERAYGIDRSPCADLSPNRIGKKQKRERVLTDAEIRAVWIAADEIGYPYGPVYKLLLLTGARKSEVAEARWPEFDVRERLWTVPPERFKSDRVHLVPLCEDAMALVESLPRHKGNCVFTTTDGRKPIDGFSKSKAALDRGVSQVLGREAEPFVIHDLRRTVRTRLSALRVPPIVAELVIGHTLPGLLGVYDQYDQLDERRDALQAWAGWLRTIVEYTGR